MKTTIARTLAIAVALLATAAQALTIDTVTVGNPGNTSYQPSNTSRGPFGSVDYVFRIGKYEVSNAEYVEFLNAVAGEDTHSLYDSNMSSDIHGGITQSGTSPSYTYAVKTNMGNKPVNYMNYFDTLRFANWLHNGQPTGAQNDSTTEDGAYTLGGVTTPSNETISRNAGGKWFLTSEDEWFKAAYHQPHSLGGDTNDYWLYPTQTNELPTQATAIDTIGPTRGDAANPGANVANWSGWAMWDGVSHLISVGSTGSSSYYGTFDQGGNIFEWLDSVYPFWPEAKRIQRGGQWNNDAKHLGTDHYHSDFVDPDVVLSNPFRGQQYWGFRVVATVPEPGSLSLFGLGLCVMMACRGPTLNSQHQNVITPRTPKLQDRLNNQIEKASFDRGFHSPENQEELSKIIKHPCLPEPRSKQSVEQEVNDLELKIY